MRCCALSPLDVAKQGMVAGYQAKEASTVHQVIPCDSCLMSPMPDYMNCIVCMSAMTGHAHASCNDNKAWRQAMVQVELCSPVQAPGDRPTVLKPLHGQIRT